MKLESGKIISFNLFRLFTSSTFWLSLVVIQIVAMLLDRFFSVQSSYILAGSDYLHYLATASMVKGGLGNLIYNVEANYEAQKALLGPNMPISILTFRSLPFVALIFIPFTFFPAIDSYRLFGLFNIFLIILIIYLFTRYVSKNKIPTLYLLTISFIFIPILETLKNGQVSILLTVILLGIFLSFRKNKYLLAGILTSLLLLKTQFIIFFPYLFILSKQKKKLMIGFMSGIAGIFLLSSVISGFDFWLQYPMHLLKTEGPEYGSRTNGLFTLYALFQNLGFGQKLSVLLNGLLFGFTLILFKKKYKTAGFVNSFISFILLSIPLSIHVLLHDLSLLILPLFLISLSLAYNFANKKVLLKSFFILAVLFVLPEMFLKVTPNYLSPIIFGMGLYFLYNRIPQRVSDLTKVK